MIPGSVHEVRLRKIVVMMIDRKKSIGIAGIAYHIFENIKIE